MKIHALLPVLLALSAISTRSPAQVPALFQPEAPWADRWEYACPLVADINRDGFLDLVVTGVDSTSRSTLATFVNDSGRGWKESRMHWTDQKFDPFGWPALTDLDGNASPDVIFLRGASKPWYVSDFPADGAQSVRVEDFRLADSLDPKKIPRAVISYGQGGHGYLDWTWNLTPRDYGFAFPYHTDFADLAAEVNPSPRLTRLLQADFNRDGRPDAVAIPGYASTLQSTYRRSGPGGYVNIPVPGFSMWGGSHEIGDYDNDGDLDLVSSGFTSHASGFVNFRAFFENSGDTLARVGFDRDGPGYGACLLADFDNDGDLDLLSIGKYAATRVHRNLSTRKNAPPAVPQGLSVETEAGRVRLTWRRSRDDLTASPGLSYNVRIGTAPDREDVLMAAADPATGRLQSTHLGNNGTDTVRTLYTSASGYLWPIPAGTYYWSVQAVDNGYAASAFSPAQSFEVTGVGTVRIRTAGKPAGKAMPSRRLQPGRQPGSLSVDGRSAPGKRP